MSHKLSDLQTCVEPLDLPALPEGAEGDPASPRLLEVQLLVRSRSEDDFVRDFHSFVQDEILILPAFPLLTIGDERAFRISLQDGGPPLLCGRIGAIERIGAVQPNGRPGWVRAQILDLDPAGKQLLGQLMFTSQSQRRAGVPMPQVALDRLSQLVFLASAHTDDIPSVDSAELQVIEDPRPPRAKVRPRRRTLPTIRRAPPNAGRAVPVIASTSPPPGRRAAPAGTLAPLLATAVVAALVGLIGCLLIMRLHREGQRAPLDASRPAAMESAPIERRP